MELLCVMAALAALFLGSAALTLKARVPAGLAPLVTLSCIVAVLTLAGMAGCCTPPPGLYALVRQAACGRCCRRKRLKSATTRNWQRPAA